VGYADRAASDGRAGEVTSRSLGFTLADSFMFSAFDGSWTIRKHSKVPVKGKLGEFRVRSQLTYSVLVRPRGPVPVAALEWRIKEDVPTNLVAVKRAVETGAYYKVNGRGGRRKAPAGDRATQTPPSSQLSRRGATTKKRSPARAGKGQKPPYWEADETLENYLA